MHKKLIITFIVTLFSIALNAQKISREQYIDLYKDLAINEMKRTGVPASIKLAQGMLESDNGNSTLARKANNHFGVKCHKDWTGKTFTHNDDRPNECFRKYNKVEESFRDQSDFLRQQQRYAFLFDLKTTDYKGWAKGLKKAGYATNKSYPELLIKIIEDNELYRFDSPQYIAKNDTKPKKKKKTSNGFEGTEIDPFKAEIQTNNRVEFILAHEGESMESLSEKADIMPWQITKYNELDKKHQFAEGERVYLQPKRRKAARGNDTHIVNEGETIWSISQLYGVKTKHLRKKNHLNKTEDATVGQELYLRKKAPKKD